MENGFLDYSAETLVVYPADILGDDRDLVFSSAVEMNFPVWDFGPELGIAILKAGGLCRRHGRPIDYPEYLRRVMPFNRKQTAIGNDRRFAKNAAESAEIPDNKYWIKISLAANTRSGEFGAYMRSTVPQPGPFTVNVYRGHPVGKDSDALNEYLTNWKTKAVEVGYLGEKLAIPGFRVSEFQSEMKGLGKVYGGKRHA